MTNKTQIMLEKISCFTVFRGGWREGHIQWWMERGAYSVVDGERGIFRRSRLTGRLPAIAQSFCIIWINLENNTRAVDVRVGSRGFSFPVTQQLPGNLKHCHWRMPTNQSREDN